MTDLKINDRDIAEINGFWAYQNTRNKEFTVNGKTFKVIDSYDDASTSNSQGASDSKTIELLTKDGKYTGQQLIVHQGTDNNETINPNNPLKGKLADDWLQNIKLMNDKNKSTSLIKQNNQYLDDYQKKISDAKHLNKDDFYKKYGIKKTFFKDKKLVYGGGNSQGAVGAKLAGVKNPNLKVVTTDPATLPEASWRGTKSKKHNNIINYHSTYDILSWVQDPVFKNNPGKRVDLKTGVPTLEGLADSHLGYKRKFNKIDNTYKDIPVKKIKSVKDTDTKKGKSKPKTINITLDMDDRIPINVWTGESISRSGNGTLIKLDIEKLENLHNLVTGETSKMLSECVKYLNESFNISQHENNNFSNRKHKLKSDFIDKICLDSLENLCNSIKHKRQSFEEAIDQVHKVIDPIIGLIPSIGLKSLEEYISDIVRNLEKGIEAIHDTLEAKIQKIFKNLDNDFHDGVAEEMMKHLKVVSRNILQVKQQNDIYGRQIADIKNIMSQQDATIMDGNTNISYSGENMVYGSIESSNYLTRKMSILKDHIDKGIKDLAEYVEELYNEYFKPVKDDIDKTVTALTNAKLSIYSIKTMLKNPAIITALKASPFSPSIVISALERLVSEIDKWVSLLNDLKVASPILENHLDDIIENSKPTIVNMIFEPSHYDDMFILNTQAQARLDQMAQQFEVVCNGLNENAGQAIITMDESASVIRSNMSKVNSQLEKLAVY